MAKTAVRADSARTIQTLHRVAARMLVEDANVSLVAIAARAGVDRRTVYRYFDNRDTLIDTIYRAAYEAGERAMDEARLDSAPTVVALHRLFEGLVRVIREYPLREPEPGSPIYPRYQQHIERFAAFVRRAVDDGLVRADLPEGLALEIFQKTLLMLAGEYQQLAPGAVSDLAVDILLNGLGVHPSPPGQPTIAPRTTHPTAISHS